MLDVYWRYAEADAENALRAGRVLSRLLVGGHLGEELWSSRKLAERQWTWVPVYPRSIELGDVVRVRADAYQGTESAHNGREGVLAAQRHGYVVTYTDRPTEGTQMGHRHPPEKLERRVPAQTARSDA